MELEALRQCIPLPRYVLPVLRYDLDPWSGSPPKSFVHWLMW